MMQTTQIAPAGICVSVSGVSPEQILAAAHNVQKQADVIEVRLDGMDRPVVQPFVKQISGPVLFTNRPEWEGGMFAGDEDDRIALLLEAIHADAAFVDVELRTALYLREQILAEISEDRQTRLICSWHNFHGTPSASELEEILGQQVASGAHIGKIVTMAHDFRDVLRILNLTPLAAEHGFPLIAFCMGEAGMISRVATLLLGGYMTYAAPDAGQGTAPGQLPVSALREILAGLKTPRADFLIPPL